MRLLGWLTTIVIVLFWGTMNTMLVVRQRELKELGKYRQGVQEFLGPERQRERWLGVYHNHKKIGYTGFQMEKVPLADKEFDFEFWTTIESVFRFDLFGRGNNLKFKATLTQDNEMEPTHLHGELAIEKVAALQLIGTREDDGFRLTIKQGGLKLFSVRLPLDDFFLGDGLTPTLPIAGFDVGDTFEVPAFDPVMMTVTEVDVTVTERSTKEIDGIFMDVFTLESRFQGTTSTSLVTADGTLLTQRFGRPLEGVVLRRETRARARHGFAK